MFYFSLFLRKNFSFYSKLLLQIKKTIYTYFCSKLLETINFLLQNCGKFFCHVLGQKCCLIVCLWKTFFGKKKYFFVQNCWKKLIFLFLFVGENCTFLFKQFFFSCFCSKVVLECLFLEKYCMFIMFSFFKKSHLRYFFYILVLVKKFNFVVVWKFVFIISQKGVILVFYFYFSLILKTIFSFYSKLLFEIVMFPCERIISVFAGFIASPLLY